MIDNKEKKKVVQINTVCNGSTGNIMQQIQVAANEKGYETISFYGRRKGYETLKCEKFGNMFSFWTHVIWTTLTDMQGCLSVFHTKKMIKRLKEEKPDIIHLHNLHGYYLNYPILFKYLKKDFKGKIVWTFHDCWPMTGHCPYFIMVQCEKWKTMCHHCPNKKKYPISWFKDSSRHNYKEKRRMFTGLDNMIIVCPSQWLSNIVQESFFVGNQIEVIPNGIDFELFSPREENTTIQKYKIPKDKKIILGVANIWEERKGLNVFCELAKRLDEKYIIVLVGLNDKQIRSLPSNIIGIKRTENQIELSQIYSKATVFMNPSKEETFSLVTVEAMACGTPVIVLDNSAVKELVNEKTGIVLHNPTMDDYLVTIKLMEDSNYNKFEIRKYAEKFSNKNMQEKYMEIYR